MLCARKKKKNLQNICPNLAVSYLGMVIPATVYLSQCGSKIV